MPNVKGEKNALGELNHAKREDQLKPPPLPHYRARVKLAVLMTFEAAVASVSLKIRAEPSLFEGSFFCCKMVSDPALASGGFSFSFGRIKAMFERAEVGAW